MDEVSYRKGHRYLIVVADRDRDGAVVWAKEGKNAKTLEGLNSKIRREQFGDPRRRSRHAAAA